MGVEATAGQVDPEVACARYGTQLVADGCEYFPDWSAAMLREYDNLSDTELQRLYEIASLVAKREVDDWPALISDHLKSS